MNAQLYTAIVVTLPNATSILSKIKEELPLLLKLSKKTKMAIVLP